MFVVLFFVNLFLTLYASGGDYTSVGIFFFMANLMGTLLLFWNKIGDVIIKYFTNGSSGNNYAMGLDNEENRIIVLSAIFLSFALRVGLIIAAFVKMGAILCMLVAILLVSDYVNNFGLPLIKKSHDTASFIIKGYLFIISLPGKIIDIFIDFELGLANVKFRRK